MNYTENYNLGLPLVGEQYDVTIVNSNNGVIDTTMKNNEDSITSHTSNKSNPHEVTAAQVGLGNVNNTSDASKPVSNLQAQAIAAAVDAEQTRAEAVETAHGNAITALQNAMPGIATTSVAGTVKPDGTTITVQNDGTISAVQPPIDSALSTTSNNAVKNSVITTAINGKQDTLTFDTTPTSASTNPVTSGGVYTALEAKADEATITAALALKANIADLGSAAYKNVPTSGNASTTQVVMGDDTRLTDSRTASDVYAWAKAATKPTYTASEVGAIASSLKGANNGVAELDNTGKVPSSQLPGFVDDVVEYADVSSFPATGTAGVLYVALDTNKIYRWGGTEYVVVSETLALGTTSSTAYRGDRGNAAYKHAVTNKGAEFASGFYKITTNGEGHVTAATAVAKADITALGIPASDTNVVGTFFGTTDTGADTATKVVTLSDTTGWSLRAGVIVGVKTTSADNTASNVKLQVNGSAAKSIWYNGAAYTGSNKQISGWNAHVIYYLFDGTYWCFLNNDNNYRDSNTWTALVGATSSANGSVGYINAVPPSNGYNTKYFRADGTWAVPPDNNTWTGMVGATSSANGSVGFINATPPKSGYNTKYWRADGSWTVPPNDNTHRPIQVNGTEILGDNTTALNLKAGTNVSVTNSSGTVTIASTDTNTHRPIQVDGTEILGDNTTALNLAGGSNVTLTESSGTVTIAATDTTYTPQKLGFGYGTCTTAAATAAKTASLSGYTLVTNGIIAIKFTKAVPAGATLNVNSKGAKNIFYHGAAINSGVLNANDVGVFIYDGTQYHLIAKDSASAPYVTGTLSAGATSITLSNSNITTNSTIDGPYVSIAGVTGSVTSIAAGSVTCTFAAQSSAMTVKCYIRND